jgi:hypothetical protein
MAWSTQIRDAISRVVSRMPTGTWTKVLEVLSPLAVPKEVAQPLSKTLNVFHISDVKPAGSLECDWLNSILPYPIQWLPLNKLIDLCNDPNPVLLYQNIPEKPDYIRQLFQKLISIVEDAEKQITILHLSDEFGIDDLTIYNSRAVKQVIRNYWRSDLHLYGDKVFTIPLGYTNGKGNGRAFSDLPTYSQRSHVWSFAGSIDRPDREKSLASLRAVHPHKEYSKNNWNSPHLVEGQEYMQMLANCKFAPCFKGNRALESFRLYEALEMGAIPVYVPSESRSSKDEYGELFGQHPLLGFPSWEKAAEVLPKLISQNEVMEKHRKNLQDWWSNKKSEIRSKLKGMFVLTA